MESTLIAVDTAKLVFEVAEADAAGKVRRRLRLNRPQFSEYLATREKASFVLEACGGAHHWARMMERLGLRSDCWRFHTSAHTTAATRRIVRIVWRCHARTCMLSRTPALIAQGLVAIARIA